VVGRTDQEGQSEEGQMRSLTFDAKKTLKGKFNASTAAEKEFYKALRKVARHAGHIVEAHVDGVKIVDEKKMQDQLKKYAETITPWARRQSAKLLETVQKSNKRAYNNKSKAIGLALQMNVAESEVGDLAVKLMTEQVALIKSIPLEAGLRAQKIAYEAVLAGTRAEANEDTIAELQKQLGLSTEVAISRAKLIAVTETARANASINQARAMTVGSRQYRWHNSGDGAVRHSHKYYRGKPIEGHIFSWDNPPTLDDGTKGHPGTFPRCRCFAEPVFDDE
jgi:SPP1 gp7 family putative phage head morphogenesis protein